MLAWVCCSLVVFGGGCSRETGVRVELKALTPVDTVTLVVAGPHGVLATRDFDGHQLPGAAFVQLSPTVGTVKIVARAHEPASLASATQVVTAGEQPTVTLTLGNASTDADADGWPDAVDNCPALANDDQADADGDGVGDACSAAGHDAGSDGGGAFDAGQADAGQADAGGARSCAGRADLATCVDFEDGGADIDGYGDAVATVVSGDAALGERALRVSRNAGTADYSGRYLTVLPLPSATSIRLFLKLGPNAPRELTLLEPHDTVGNLGILVYLTTTGGVPSGFSVFNRVAVKSFDFPATMTLNEWHCLEFRLTPGDASHAKFEVWVDDVPVSAATSGGAYVVDRVFVGASYNVNEGGTVLLDDVSSSSNRIGCR